MPERTVFHCFTGGVAEARRCVEMGAHLSFSGIVTFKNSIEVHDAARWCPIDRLLVETDSPYLAPTPHRGRPNQPAYVTHVARFIADLRDIAFADLASHTVATTRAVLGCLAIPPAGS
jgi:TatD DNase family protein